MDNSNGNVHMFFTDVIRVLYRIGKVKYIESRSTIKNRSKTYYLSVCILWILKIGKYISAYSWIASYFTCWIYKDHRVRVALREGVAFGLDGQLSTSTGVPLIAVVTSIIVNQFKGIYHVTIIVLISRLSWRLLMMILGCAINSINLNGYL